MQKRLLLTTVKHTLRVSLYEGVIFLSWKYGKKIKEIRMKKVVEIEIERLIDFKNHPFKVQADSQMKELQYSRQCYCNQQGRQKIGHLDGFRPHQVDSHTEDENIANQRDIIQHCIRHKTGKHRSKSGHSAL